MARNTAPHTGLDNSAANAPRLLLADHHREIEDACLALRAGAYEDDPIELVGCYRAFERAMLEHIAAEEDSILPGYETYAPEDARVIRAQHVELRQQLFRMGIDVELHCMRAEGIERLVKTLRAHAAQEDRGMYPWAQVHLALPTQ